MTTTNAALVSNGIVVNRIIVGGDYTPPAGLELIPETVATGISGIGWTWNGTSFISPPANSDPLPTPGQIRDQSFRDLPERQDIITRLRTATPAQIDSWLLANVTNLAQARTVLGALIKVFCVGAPA